MKRAGWFLAGIGVLLGALLACAWLVPPMLDWNRFRPEIEAFASEALGRQVTIRGPVSLTLLPQPVLTASAIGIGEGSDDAGRMTAAQLRLAVSLRRLYAGRVEAREVVLRGIDLRLPWPPPADALVFRPPAWLSDLSARVEGGTVTIGRAVAKLTEATLSTAEGTGTYNVAGTGELGGRSWRFTAQLSRPGGDGSAALNASLDGQGASQGIGAAVSGQIAADGSFAGRIAGRAPNLSQLMPGPAVPFRTEGRLTVGGGLAVADQLTGELAGAPAQGAVALRISPATRLDLALTASRLDLDAWWNALVRQGDGDALPDFAIGIDLSAELAQFAGGSVRGLRAAFDLAGGAAELRELRAVLPGEAALRASGRFTLPAPKRAKAVPARFDGSIATTMPAPRATLSWLLGSGFDPATILPGGVLRAAQLSGHLVYEPGQITLDTIEGKLDDTTAAGSLALRLPATPASRPALAAELRLGTVALDPFLTAPPALPGLSAIDVNAKLEAEAVRLAGLSFDHVVLDGTLDQGRPTLRRFAAGLNGIALTASGAMQEGGRLADGKFTLDAPGDALRNPELAPYLPAMLLRLIPREAGFWAAPVSLRGEASGTAAALGVKLQGTLGDLRVEFQPVVDIAKRGWAGSLTLHHPGAPRLAQALGFDGAGAWLGDGSLSLVAQLSGQPGRVAADGLDLAAGSLRATGSLVLAATQAGQAVTGKVALETLPLPVPALHSTHPLPWVDLSGWEASVQMEAGQVLLGQAPAMTQAKATLSLAAGVLRLDGVSATMAGGQLAGDAGLDTLAQPPKLTLHAKLAAAAVGAPLFGLPLDLAGGAFDAAANLSASGYAPSALLATLGGDIQVTGRDGVLAGLSLAALKDGPTDAAARAALSGGSTGFTRMSFSLGLDHGIATLREASLAGGGGTLGATGSLDLPAGTANLHFDLSPAMEDPPKLGLRLTGPLAAPERVPELSDLIRWRAEHPAP